MLVNDSEVAPPPPTLWESVVAGLPSVVLGALTIALGALVIWLATLAWRRMRGPRPVMRMRIGMGNAWVVENLSRKPLLNAEWMGVNPDSTNMTPHMNSLGMPDFLGRTSISIGTFPDQATVVFAWIRDDKRRSAEVRIEAGDKVKDIVPRPLERRRLRLS